MKSTIITIGDEILIGQILDTNSQYISQSLNALGVVVAERTSIGDDAGQIVRTLDRSLSVSDIVIITGGLGPTKDDITKHALARYFGSSLRYDEATAEHVRTLLARRGVAFNDLNRGQAMVPECCTVLHNGHGTAPGMWFERDGKVVVSLPGVPFEMVHLMEDEVLPRLKNRFALRAILHRTMITSGIAESILAERIAAWEDALPPYLKLAYLPAPNIVRLRLSAYEVDGESVRQVIDREFAKLYDIIPEAIVGFEQASVEQMVHQRLIERGETLSVAESCTGGNIASKFTAQAGASQYFLCGVVSYSNEAKYEVLGVDEQAIRSHGAVSEQVACQMAEGVRRISGATYGVSTTGIAGPTGGSAEKPVGTVWIGISTPDKTYAVCRNCGTDRGQIIQRATAYAIKMLQEEL
ncbi:MAG: competence/damage-inducible protein A [Alistipes sp.]|nr:competence/damage-inducible protein A [Alistipes sp.]